MKKINFLSICLLLLGAGMKTNAQDARGEFAQLMNDDSVDINTIALYPAATRENIFIVSSHSEGILKIEDAQKKSQETFRNLIAPYSKEDQQKIWNLTRYDDLLAALSKATGKNNTEEVLKKFPPEIHDDALDIADNHHDLIVSLDKMNNDFNASFHQAIAGYGQPVQTAFQEMLNTPEALSLLCKNMHMTVHLGSIYQSDAAMLKQQFDSLNLAVAEQKAKEQEEWKQEMKNDPDAQKELKESAGEYAKENGLQEKDYENTDPVVVEHYVLVPYPYWCGYPSWYADEYWYPYPYWYHTGFYFRHGEMIWMGPPSWYFVHWYFHQHPHYYHYPHFTNVCINHYYYGPRRVISRNSVEIHAWMRVNEKVLPGDFRTNREQRIDRIRELGKADMALENYHKNNPGKNLSRDEFIRQHPEDFPHLRRETIQEKEPIHKPTTNPDVKPREKKEPEISHPSPTPRRINREQAKPATPETVPVKPGRSEPKVIPHKSKQEVTPRQLPPKTETPQPSKNKKQNQGRKKMA